MILDAPAIQERIANLEKQRDVFVTEANLKVAQFNGAISAYQALLSEMEAAKNIDGAAEGATTEPVR